jgi:hypothetical protein
MEETAIRDSVRGKRKSATIRTLGGFIADE